MVEQISQKSPASSSIRAASPKIISLKDVEKQPLKRLSSQIGELDRVLGGGVVYGSLILVSGEPGIGKSTLLTQLAMNLENSLYVAGEESPTQIKIRVDRMDSKANFNVLSEVNVDSIIRGIEEKKPSLVIVDSIQTLETDDLNSPPGSVGQVRECTQRLLRVAKAFQIPIFLVGHVTKDGTVAGPKTLEHMVDVVLSLEGDPLSQFRILRSNKNRFGPTDEVGIFEMEESGILEVKNPSRIFLGEELSSPGSAVIATLNGQRPLLVEVQALVTRSNLPIPKRVSTGVDNNRLQLLVAVLSKRLNLSLFDKDVFVNVTGGMKIIEPAADLGIAMAIMSSLKDKALPKSSVFIGEVGLLGEIRMVRDVKRRVQEAKKLGFTNPITPENTKNMANLI